MKEIDARGLNCPQPVIMAKRATDTKVSQLDVLVDNRAALENVTRFANHSGYEVQSMSIGDNEWRLSLTRNC